MIKVAINGFGRIGRLVLRALWERQEKDIQVVAINDLGSLESNAHLFGYDTVHGRFPGHITIDQGQLDIGLGPMAVFSERDPSKLPWKDLQVDVVFECSGHFTARDKAKAHLDAGAKRVLISAPGKDVDATVVYGVNHQTLTEKDHIVSNASCTTNCLAPVAMVLDQAVGIQHGYMTTIHAYTGDQCLVDSYHTDLRRARSAARSMIPTSTGAAKAVGLVLPDLKGKLDGTAIRVPTANVSLIDFTFTAKKETTSDAMNQALVAAAQGPLKGILAVNDLPLVSEDFCHHPASSIIDLDQTQVVEGTFCRVLSWYDNEWGFSHRMLDTAKVMGSFL